MGLEPGRCKAKQTLPRHKRVEELLLPAAGKESLGVFSKAVCSLNKGSMGFYLGSYTYSYRRTL
jgi:hypothetical protein